MGSITGATSFNESIDYYKQGRYLDATILGFKGLLEAGLTVATFGASAALRGTTASADTIVAGANSAEIPLAQVTRNQISGNIARDNITARFPGARTEVSLPTLDDFRRLDVLTSEGLAIESKVGRTSLSPEIQRQVLKDVQLFNDPLSGVKSLTWEFSPSPLTRKVDPTAPLENFLRQNRINIIINR